MLALLCSGQGAQHPGMFDLTEDAPQAQPVFEAAASLLGIDPRDLVEQPNADLHGNRTGQILCCTAALAAWKIIDQSKPSRLVVAGYSIGDLAAWGCAGRLEPGSVLRLAAVRAEAMDAASGEGYGLAGIRGLSLDTVTKLAERHACQLAIRNAPDSAVVGGLRTALEAVCTQAAAAGAQRAILLPVRTPSHTPLLVDASQSFAQALARETLQRPPPGAPRLIQGLDGTTLFDPAGGLDKLARQISQTIDWAGCLEACRELGAESVLELGPGRSLATMARDALPGARVHALEDFRSIEGVNAWIERRRLPLDRP
ncbi:malonate decarboxylase subunit epsilon [Methylobacterium sp. C25]|uniref:malonate decarboxylase subunit epsilon n=1 Tax=Methylobacterium sp. C25 TaxID=2721622 RepID=UPI00227888E6|nr:malonate decarboxylase subunit epsilon [Methylobacterium sp. C25]MCE4224090.1 malonate decarboxylase subunit epsilon [Methylobacterium sp. C25]